MMPADVFAPLCPSLVTAPPLSPCHALPHFSAYLLLSTHGLVAQNVMASSLSGVGVRVPRLVACCAARVVTPHHEILSISLRPQRDRKLRENWGLVCLYTLSLALMPGKEQDFDQE